VWQQEQFLEQIETFQPLLGLEISTNSKSILATTLPNPCTILVGGERYGVPSDLLARCQQVVHIPMYGVNGSMNVTHALAIALFEWRRQWS
jgi:tRNA G18 (ribose-2'-O)-methylase SpoU